MGSIEVGADVVANPDTSSVTTALTGQTLTSSLGTPTIATNVTIVSVGGLAAQLIASTGAVTVLSNQTTYSVTVTILLEEATDTL